MAGALSNPNKLLVKFKRGSKAMKLRNKILLSVMTVVTLGLWQGVASAASTAPSDVMQNGTHKG